MSGNKTLRGNVEIFVAYPEAFANKNTPTSAELNDTAFVKVISCAVNDDYTLNPSSSDTDNTQSVCDVSAIETPTFTNYECALNIFSDADQTAAGVYNLARDLFKAKGIPLILGKRVGVAQGTAFAAGQIISLFQVTTDNPGDVDAAGSPMQLAARFKPQGWSLPEYEVAS